MQCDDLGLAVHTFEKGVPHNPSGQARHAPWNAGNALRAKLYVRVRVERHVVLTLQ